MEVEPGASIVVEIRKSPTGEAARKTLLRVCAKDSNVQRQQRRQKAQRPSWQDKRRGGRFWHHQMKSQSPVSLAPGRTYELRATLDVVRDLESVARYVNITTR